MRAFRIFTLIATLLLFSCQKAPAPPLASEATPELPSRTQVAIPSLSDSEIELVASWDPLEGKDLIPLEHNGCIDTLTGLSVAEPKRRYRSSDFACLLPAGPVRVGEMWQVERGAPSRFLSQFHPEVVEEMNRDASGAYGMVRAVSQTELEVVFRLHAQFAIAERSTISPGQFAGRLIIDRAEGTVKYFALTVPTEHKKNLNYEMQCGDEYLVGMVFVPRMELIGGKLAEYAWDDELEPEQAKREFAQRFFKFEKLQWVPFEQAVEHSRLEQKPIFAIVIMGALNDQSC